MNTIACSLFYINLNENEPQSSKSVSSIRSLLGIVTSVSEVHPAKHLNPIILTPSAIIALFKRRQLVKALLSISIRVEGVEALSIGLFINTRSLF